ncbi:MAG: acyltransferase family protein [Bacilli bacterium]|nr:acyltransferase family protein [Bacilli bacterium]
MNKKNEYYKYLDILRIISCIGVLFYHLDILKGGYLAVCTFFTLSGYLSCYSLLNKEKISIKDYYLNRLKKLYLPLLIVVFITITIISFIPNIIWLNLKPETTSILLGYNNFWQLTANLDYFARHIDSPFIHLWYLSILFQFDLIFPFAFILLNKIKKKEISSLIALIISFISYGYFIEATTTGNIMISYYHTLSRVFSILLGVSLAFILPKYQKNISLKIKEKNLDKIVFYLYTILLVGLFLLIDSKHHLFKISMLLTSVLTIRLIDYSTIIESKKRKQDKFIKSLSSISYEIYLVQYPIIYIFQNIMMNNYIKIIIIVLLTIIISYIIHLSINIKKEDKYKIIKIIICILISIISLFGLYKYIVTKDYTKDMKKLEKELANNKLLTEQKQKEYSEKQKEEKINWENELKDLENNEKKLKEIVTNLNIIGVGDSVMLGAINSLYQTFPNGYFDAAVSRTDFEANPILVDLKNKGLLGDIIVFNLGTNGEGPEYIKKQILETIGDRKLFWVNATKPDFPSFNTDLIELVNKKDNIYLVDWISVAKEHPEYLVADGIHLTKEGSDAYANTIYNTIYNMYLEKYNKQKEEKIKEHENNIKNKITFIGNDLLINSYEYIESNYPSSEYITNDKYTFESLKNELEEKIKDNNLSYNIVFIFDNSFNITLKEYQDLSKICKDYNIYILTLKKISIDNIKTIDFSKELEQNNNYLMPDRIHLTKEGNMALSNIIKENIKI